MFYGWQQIALGYIIFIVAAWQFYPGASMELATLIATVAGLFIAGCYGLLSMVYPRSGGDYVFMSRILHPVAGIALSMSLVFWQLFYTGVNGAFLSKFGIAPMLSSLGVQEHSAALIGAGNWFAGKWGLFLGGVFVVGFFSFVQYRGAGVYFKVQRWASYITAVSLLITFVTLALAATGVLDFHHNFDVAAGAGAYDNVLAAAGNTQHPFSLTQSIFWNPVSLHSMKAERGRLDQQTRLMQTMVSCCHSRCLPASFQPPHRSTTVRPSSTTLTAEPTSSSVR